MAYRDIPNIDTLGEAGDIDAPVGSRAWAIAVRGELSVCLTDEASNRGRIKHLTEHLRAARHDNSSRRGLLQMVGQRRRLLAYLHQKSPERYQVIIGRLGLRR